jgi:hypothetical protein
MSKAIEKTEAGWTNDCNRFVGYADIMGFQNLISRKSHEEVGLILRRLLSERNPVKNLLKSSPDTITAKQFIGHIETVAFSDSVLFISKDDKPESLVLLSIAMNLFHASSLVKQAPVKGAIAYGRFTADFENSLFYGQPLVDAYLLEQQVHYYGIVVDNSLEQKMKSMVASGEMSQSDLDGTFSWLKTPLKGGLVNHYNLNGRRLDEDTKSALYNSVSGSTRKYVDNTIETFEKMFEQASK